MFTTNWISSSLVRGVGRKDRSLSGRWLAMAPNVSDHDERDVQLTRDRRRAGVPRGGRRRRAAPRGKRPPENLSPPPPAPPPPPPAGAPHPPGPPRLAPRLPRPA